MKTRLFLLALTVISPILLTAGEDNSAPRISADTNLLEQAGQFLQKAISGDITETQLLQAADMLDNADPFVAALAEWTLASKVGRDNDRGEINWPSTNSPVWYQRWTNVPVPLFVDYDWIRHAHQEDLENSKVKLCASADDLVRRGQAAADHAADAKRPAVEVKLGELRAIRAAMTRAESLPEIRKLWLSAHRTLRSIVFAGRDLDFESIVFYTRHALHHKPNVCGIQTSWAYKPGGDICILKGLEKDGVLTPLIKTQLGQGHVHGMDLNFDAGRIVFGWASQPIWPPRDGKGRLYDLCHVQNNYAYELMKVFEPNHLYEINSDGTGVRKLTNHDYWNDIEPVYCPDGSIVFTSDRTAHAPSCDGWENDIPDTNLYRLTPDRKKIWRVTNQKDVDMYPHLLDSGLIGYLRWEYIERDFWDVHAIWTVRSDGVMNDALFKQHFSMPTSIREARSIPGTGKLVALAVGHHCQAVGPIVVVDPSAGMNTADSIQIVTPGVHPQERAMAGKPVAEGGVKDIGGLYLEPFALSEKSFLATYSFAKRRSHYNWKNVGEVSSNDGGIYFIDVYGNKELIFRDRLHTAINVMPFKKRGSPPVMPHTMDVTRNYATCIVPDVYEGMKGVEPGTIKYIRLVEELPWPLTKEKGSYYHGDRTQDLKMHWCPVRVIGTVPVETDGSAHFKVPTAANACVTFQALDGNHMEIQRMRTSVSFQPGEQRSCNGCHETRPLAPARRQGIAATRVPDTPIPPPWGISPFSYEKQLQPVLDRNCVSCHGGDKPAKALDLTSTRIHRGLDSMCGSYFHIVERGLVSVSNRTMDGSITRVKQFGSHNSKLITALLSGEQHRKLKIPPDDWLTLVTWVDLNCPYYDTLYDKRPTPESQDLNPATMTPKALKRWAAPLVQFPWKDPWAFTVPVDAEAERNRNSSESALFPVPSARPGYSFIIGDYSHCQIVKFDADGKATWVYDKVKPIDVWAMPDGTVLTAYLPSPLTANKGGVRLVNPDKTTVFDYPFNDEIMSVQPLANGNFLMAECHYGRITEMDRTGKRIHSFLVKSKPSGHTTMRQIRLTTRGTIIVGECYSHKVREYDRAGALLKEHDLRYAYCPQPLPDGHTLVGCWNAPEAQVVELDADGKVVWRLTPAELPKDMSVTHIAGCIRLPGGNTLVSVSCKAGKGTSPRPMLFEITQDKKIVWTMMDKNSSTWMTVVKLIPSWNAAQP